MSSRSPSGNNSKLLGLEIIRFISAIAVLFWHYQHFSFIADKPTDFAHDQQPLYRFFSLFYDYGFYGVQIFWCISGFIFFWKYRQAVADGMVSGKKFFVLRFSRLYPLHGVTLLLVGGLQLAYLAQKGYYFVYQNNDVKHFLLQLFLASNWGFQKGYSFNGPIWSISVEVVVYLLFFLLLRVAGKSALVNVGVLLACGLAKWLHVPSLIIDSVAFFYAGGLAAMASRYVDQRALLRYAAVLVAVSAPLAVYASNVRQEPLVQTFLLLYVPVLLYVCSREFAVTPRVQKLIEAAGNMTYSSYLIHFPIQLSAALLCAALQRPIPYYSVKFFLLFMGATLVAAYYLYRWFELPAQNAVRRRFA
jgi:peptidoglycan/LPS O-acetylase OafA/YrhL